MAPGFKPGAHNLFRKKGEENDKKNSIAGGNNHSPDGGNDWRGYHGLVY